MQPDESPPPRRGLFRAIVRPGRLRPWRRRGRRDGGNGGAGLASLSASAADALAASTAPPPPLPEPTPLDAALSFVDGLASSLASALPPWLRGVAVSQDSTLSPVDAAWRETSCFPSRIAPPAAGDGGRGAASHQLAAVGTRAFNLMGASLRIYDFAVYVKPEEAQKSAALKAAAKGPAGLEFSRALRSADDVPKTLVVRTRRALPLPLMKAEYARILSRRIVTVGGSPDDGALQTVISLFRSDVLPPSARGPAGMVRAGTVLEFGRAPGGRLSIALDGVPIGEVESKPLSAAVYDIYLGRDLPACPAAARAGCERVKQWVVRSDNDEEDHEPGPLAGELVCGRAGGCVAALG